LATFGVRLPDGSPLPTVHANTDELRRANDLLSQTSIVIPVRDDVRIFSCIESIREDAVEIVVVSNGSPPEFRRLLELFLGHVAKTIFLGEPGIGRAYNAGINAASGRYILLMDSDCIFAKNSVRHLIHGLKKASLVKGRVEFSVSGYSTLLAAKARTVLEDPLRSGRVTAYSPPLVYDRNVVSMMGGYHFSDDLAWREDRDFELRRRAAEIPVALAPEAVIHHAPLAALSDLKSVYRYGQGEAVGRTMGYFPAERRSERLRKSARTAVRILRKEKMPVVGVYFLCRRSVFNLGRVTQQRSLRKAVAAAGSTDA
jgi:glycosyltransferase involved in cell wall biosynthesis